MDSIAGGGGLISLPAFFFAGLPAHVAIGTNKLSSTLGTSVSTARYFKQGFVPVEMAVCSSVAALITFIIHGTVYYPLGLAAAVFCIAGHYIGSGMVVSNGRKIVRPVVLCVLAVLFIKVLSGN